MKFLTQHNGEVIALEYQDEDCQDGQVYQCEATYKGVTVTDLLIDQYDKFLRRCELNLAACLNSEADAAEQDRCQERYEAKKEVLRHYTAQLEQSGGY
jgi:hypothetical protein